MNIKRKKRTGTTDFQLLQTQAEELEAQCFCCERHCGINRVRGERGFCGNGTEPVLTKFFITHGEEEILTPSRMTYAAGCNIRCAYCSNAEFIRPGYSGPAFDFNRMAREIDDDFRSGRIRCVQLLGGEPACWLSGAVKLVSRLKTEVPVVWNSNFYFSSEAFGIIREFVDFYAADFKFGNDVCAEKLAGCPHYVNIVKRRLLALEPDRFLIRQLPLHGHLECCTRPILKWIAENLPETPVNFNELLPNGRCRGLNAEEKKQLGEMVREYNIRRIRSVPEMKQTETVRSCFSGEILIRPDGTVAIQDFAAPVQELMKQIEVIREK